MNGLDQILQEILADAQTEARETQRQAQTQVQHILHNAQARVAAIQAEAEEQAQQKQKHILARMKSAGAVQARQILLQEKQQLIQQVLVRAHETLLALEDTDYFAYLQKILEQYASVQSGTLLLSQKDYARVTPTFRQAATAHHLTLAETAEKIDGGFFLVYGDVMENCTFAALFAAEKDRLQDVAQQVLFGVGE